MVLPFLQTNFLVEEESFSQPIDMGGDLFLPTVILGAVVLLLVGIALLFILRFFFRRQARGRHGGFERTVLQITLPKFRRAEDVTRETSIEQIRQSIAIADSFFSTMGGLKAQRGLKAWLFGRTDEMSFEIVVRNGLIYFYIAVSKKMQTHVEQQLSSTYSDAHIEEVEDYNIFRPTGVILGSYLIFKRPSAFPIKTYQKLDADPLNALTNALSKLGIEEGAAIQYVIRSARREWRSKGLGIARRMQQGMKLEDVLQGKDRTKKNGWMSLIFSGGTVKPPEQPESYRLSPMEEESVKGLEQKASKAGLDVNIRLVVSSENPDAAQTTMTNLLSAFSQYNSY